MKNEAKKKKKKSPFFGETETHHIISKIQID